MGDQEACYGGGSIAIAIVGTFISTCLVLVVAGLVYRQWRRNKGKHLVLVTDPEIVEEAYAFDNPCFKDCTPGPGRSLERPIVLTTHSETPPSAKEINANRWSTPWSNLGRADKRRTLDDSCLGPKAKTVNVVALRSRDFTGLGFNVCGNMREGIFVKDLLHRGPASESGRIHPGDRISSVKISFRSMVYEDALTILSYASPYDVELEVESGGDTTAKPTTLLKRSVGPTTAHIYHPLYRSHSIPELTQQQQQQQPHQLSSGGRKHGNNATSKRLFAVDPNDSSYSNYSTLNSTLKSSKSTPGSQSLERRHEDHHQPQQQQQQQNKANHLHKFGIKVLPALDGTVHRIENQNEHNTNLERRHSKKLEFADKRQSSNGSYVPAVRDEGKTLVDEKVVPETLQQRSATAIPNASRQVVHVTDGIDVPDRASEIAKEDKPNIPTQVPAEVHNAAMAARRNRKSSNLELLQQQQSFESEPMQQESTDIGDVKSPQKGKRKAPAPPSRTASIESGNDNKTINDNKTTNGIGDYKESEQTTTSTTSEKSTTKEESGKQASNGKTVIKPAGNRRNSESDTDSEIQNSFTTIELNSADITVHHTPVPETNDDEDEDDADSVYRKAASLGDLSKYESKTAATLERAQSLDMTTDTTGSKKRKAPIPPPEDINESTEDLTKLDQIETFDRRKLKKSSEWGTLEDAIWSGANTGVEDKVPRIKKKSGGSNDSGTLERSKSDVEIKVTKDHEDGLTLEPVNVSDGAIETSLELYNLPLTKKLTQDFIRSERQFDLDEDNALARLVNDGETIKSPTAEQMELEFRITHPPPDYDDEDDEAELELEPTSPDDTFEQAVRYFDLHASKSPLTSETKVSIPDPPEELYAGRKLVTEEPVTKVRVTFGCPGCDHHHEKHSNDCTAKKLQKSEPLSHLQTVVDDTKGVVKEADQQPSSRSTSANSFEMHFAKPIINIPSENDDKSDVIEVEDDEVDEDEAAYEFGNSTITVNSKNLSPSPGADKRNVSSVSVSSGENSEDSGLVRESSRSRRANPSYVTEIKVSQPTAGQFEESPATTTNCEEALSENEEIISIMEAGNKRVSEATTTPNTTLTTSSVTLNVTSNGKLPPGKKPPVPPRRSDATRYVTKNDVSNPEKQVVYVSEYKSPVKSELKASPVEAGSVRKFDNWILVKDEQQEINPWGNGSSPPQPITNIVVSDEKKSGRK